MAERLVTITENDVEFIRLALEHYTLFAEASERQGTKEAAHTAGIFRKQEFYAEMLLLRVTQAAP